MLVKAAYNFYKGKVKGFSSIISQRSITSGKSM